MSFFSEPDDKPGVAQILSDTERTPTGDRAGQVWLRAKDNTSPKRFSPLFAIPDAIAWLAGAGLFARLVLLTQVGIQIGFVNQVSAIVGLGVVATVLTYIVSRMRPSERFYRVVLFTFGILIAVL